MLHLFTLVKIMMSLPKPMEKSVDLGETSKSQREWCFSHVFLNAALQCPETKPLSSCQNISLGKIK